MNKFESNISATYGAKGKEWLENLASLTKKTAHSWNLSNLKPLDNLSYNYVLEGKQEDQPIILKISLDFDSINREAKALSIFQDFGAVKLLRHEPGMLLLEKVIDGMPLKSCKVTNKTEIFCDLAKTLFQAEAPKDKCFPHINKQLEIIDQKWDIPSEYLNLARKLKSKLLERPAQKTLLLHGDLHHLNILRSGKSWKIIDPKGVIGQPINEVWKFVNDFEPDTKFIADYFNWDVNLVRDWYFVQVTMAALWCIEDNSSPAPFLKLIKKVYHHCDKIYY